MVGLDFRFANEKATPSSKLIPLSSPNSEVLRNIVTLQSYIDALNYSTAL
jgi:hypothetical protein